MQPTEHLPSVEAFLLIEQPRQRIGHWTKALAELDGPGAPPLAAIIAYYDPTCDQALLDLQYHPATANMKWVADIAVLAEVGMVQPIELSEGERARFLSERLSRCTIRVTSQRSAAGALGELVRRIKEVRGNKVSTQPPSTQHAAHKSAQSAAQGSTHKPASSPVPPPIPPVPPSAVARSVSPRGDTDDPVMLVHAKGTRDNLEKLPDTLGDGPEPPPPPRREITEQNPLARPDRHRTVPMPLELSQRLIGESSGLMDLRSLPKPAARGSDASLPGISTVDTQKRTQQVNTIGSAETGRKPPPPTVPMHTHGHKTPLPRMRTEQHTDPYLPTPGQPQLPDVIHARYLRSGRWVPVRVGALSLKGAVLLAGALPRIDDRVDVAFQFGSHRAIVRGIVGKVSTGREATQSGASTFTIAFDLDAATRTSLTSLLMSARDAKITIKPPPPRVTRRFPVEWQVALGTIRGAVKATALDVSTQGMFVQPASNLEVGSTLTFSVVLDDGTSPIAGRARVVRQIKEVEAKACGLAPGFGLVVVSMSEADRMRWLGFLARIERRADKRVLIGAEPSRLAELQAALASLGYAVGAAGDPGALVQLANSEARAADAVLIDAGWLKNEASATLMENLFSKRNVPCVTMQGEVRRARQQIDRLLEVVV